MLNQLLPDGDSAFFLCPTNITAGMPVLIGRMPAVAIDSYNAISGGTAFAMKGVYALTVIGQSTASPNTTEQVNPGDELFATGTLDVPTNVTWGLTLDKTIGHIPFGALFQTTPVAAGATNTAAAVRINQSVSTGQGA